MNAARKIARRSVIHRGLRKDATDRTPGELAAINKAARRLTESMAHEYPPATIGRVVRPSRRPAP